MIESINHIAEIWWGWMANMFWQVGILIVLVAGIDLLIRKWAWPQVRYALWLLILVKLLLPTGLSSPMSVTSRLGGWPDTIQISQTRPVPVVTADGPAEPGVIDKAEPMSESVSKLYQNQLPDAHREPAPSADGLALSDTHREMAPSAGGLQIKSSETPVETPTILAVEASVSWQVIVMGVWLAGVAVLTVWLIVRGRRLGRQFKVGSSQAMPKWFSHMLEGTAGRLGLKRVPVVVLSSTVRCPAVYGVFRPKLLMPADKLEQLSRADVEHILLHEMSHIRRGDLLVHAIAMMLTIVYWFHPLLWWVRRQLHHLRELCCDATVARLLREKTTHYRDTLLEAARQLLAEPVEPGLGLLGLFEDANRLMARLKWLEKKSWKYRPLQIGTVLAVIVIMSACVLPMASAKDDTIAAKDEKIEVTETSHQGNIATLSNGVTVELVGVCDQPSEGKQWWRADGSVLERSPYDRTGCSIRHRKNRQVYQAAVRVEGTSETPGFRFAIPLAQSSGSGDVFKSNEQIRGMYGVVFDMPSESTQGEIRIGIASGSWSTRSTVNADMQGVTVKDDVVWHQPTLENDKTIINTAHNYSDENSRVIAICKDNTIIVAGSSSGSTHGFESIQTRFDTPLSNISEFQLQTRPYEWVTFKNVSLKRGQQTDVGMDVGEPLSPKKSLSPVVQSQIDDQGRLVDKIDYPFVNDPEVIGGWKSIDFVKSIDDFDPDKKSWKGQLYLNHLIFEKNGKISGHFFKWTKGLVIDPKDKTACRYVIKTINGDSYLFFEWKTGDYTLRHQPPSYYVLKKVLVDSIKNDAMLGDKAFIPPTSIIDERGRIIDKIDYPFINDPEAIGRWVSVDYVNAIDQFKPGQKRWKGRGGDLYLREMMFKEDGNVMSKYAHVSRGHVNRWTKGLVLSESREGNQAEKYIIKTIGNDMYMFIEWKSGDYTSRHMKPDYYVLKKVSSPVGKPGTIDIVPSDYDIREDKNRGVCTLCVTLHNRSQVAIPKFKLRYYRGDPADNLDEAGNVMSGWSEVGPIEPGKSWTECSRGFHLSDGEYEFHVVLDYDNAVSEMDEHNNHAALKVKISDGQMVGKTITMTGQFETVTDQWLEQAQEQSDIAEKVNRSFGRLDFRIAPTKGDSQISDEEIQKYREQLTEKGPGEFDTAAPFRWFSMKEGMKSGDCITGTYQGRDYILLHTQKPYVMLASKEWGVEGVSSVKDQSGRLGLMVTMDRKGSALLEEITAANIGKPMAIVLDGEVISAPNIASKVSHKIQITGRFDGDDIRRMAAALCAGMPAVEPVPTDEDAGVSDKLKAFTDEQLKQAEDYYDRLVAAYEQQDWQKVDDLAKELRDMFRRYGDSMSQRYQEQIRPEVQKLMGEVGELSDDLHDAVRDKKEYLIDPFYEGLGKKWRQLKEKFSSGNEKGNSTEEPRGQQVAHPTKIYYVNRSVAEFEGEDFSTPEAAYAAMNRVAAKGDNAEWARVSVPLLAKRLKKEKQYYDVPTDWATVLQNAKILKVWIAGDKAVVAAELPQEFSSDEIRGPIDIRSLKNVDSQWLNAGNDRVNTLEQAEELAQRALGRNVSDGSPRGQHVAYPTMSYEVNRSVTEFGGEDFSTPEAAYAAMNRISAKGDNAEWARVSVPPLAELLKQEKPHYDVPKEWVDVLENAKIVKVWIKGDKAVVAAELPQEFTSEPIRKPIDVRHLEKTDGRWLNTGNDRVDTLEQAEQIFQDK